MDDGRFKMNPPIRSAADREALIEGLLDGTVDCIATDHAPHTAQEKSRRPPGQPQRHRGAGERLLRCCTPSWWSRASCPWPRLLNALCVRTPGELFRLPGGRSRRARPADLTVLDLNRPHVIDSGSVPLPGPGHAL